jgi:hypothetical protein
MNRLRQKFNGAWMRVYVWWKLRRFTRAGIAIMKYGNVRQIKYLARVTRRIGYHDTSGTTTALSHQLDSKAEELVLRRKWSWRNWRR